MIHVIATITARPGRRDELLAEFRQILAKVRAEPGCIAYGPAVDAASDIAAQHAVGSDAFVVIEQWADLAALQAHLQTPHMLDYREKVRHLVAGSEIRILEPAD